MAHSQNAGAPRPGRSRARTPVVRVVSTETQTFVLYSPTWWGQPIHWMKGRSFECFEGISNCQMCIDSIPSKWKAYIHAHHLQKQEDCFLELTDNAIAQFEALIPANETIRGLQLQVSKTKGGAKGRYILAVMGRRVPETDLKQPENPIEVLRFLWACKNQHLRDA